MTRTALGFRAHSGWAALVALADSSRPPVVVHRQRLQLSDPASVDAKQPFHAAENLPLRQAEQWIARCTRTTRQRAQDELAGVIEKLHLRGFEVAACGNLRASGRPLGTLAATLASHALIHTAEGEFYRDVLVHASQQCRLPVREFKERELFENAGGTLKLSSDELEWILRDWGKLLGPPWQQDQKYAALAAWLALAPA
ncbi:MAG: hypothetical protein C5B51_21585 [Terriglobia bacterium]|nr:MAG: hypothetical protein C5B51_21585 [Terriglobia bacterium]